MFRLLLFGFLCLTGLAGWGQTVPRIDSLPQRGLLLEKGWKWHRGDKLDWAKANLDDSGWDTLNPTLSAADPLAGAEIGWFRLTFAVDRSLLNQPFIIDVTPKGALEIYLNGKWIHSSGRVNHDPAIEEPVSGDTNPPNVVFSQSVNTLAVRYSLTKAHRGLLDHWAFRLILIRLTDFSAEVRSANVSSGSRNGFLAGLILMLALVHFSFYYFYRPQRANLFFGSALLVLALAPIAVTLLNNGPKFLQLPFWSDTALMIAWCSSLTVFPIVALTAVYQYLQRPYSLVYWSLVGLSGLFWVGVSGNPAQFFSLMPGALTVAFCTFLNYVYISYRAAHQQVRNADLILYGGLIFVGLGLLTVSFDALFFRYYPKSEIVLSDADLYGSQWIAYGLAAVQIVQNAAIPFSISLALARDFAQTSFSLRDKLVENEHLFAERQHLLTTQNERLEQEVETRTAELKASQAQLIQKEKLASLGELTAGIAHEIQNPLNFVNNFAEVSTELVTELEDEQHKVQRDAELESELLADLKANLQKIHHHGGRASAIVKGMLEHARTETGEKRPTDLNALAQEYLTIAYQGLRAKDKADSANRFNCELVTDFDSTLGQVELVPQEIGRVLLNLYNNAFYAMNERAIQYNDSNYKPTVEVSTRHSKSGVKILVKDNGTGISDSVKAKIFQPFFTTKPTGEGTGLGLSLSYDIVTKGHGGSLTVESREGEGTAFVIQLPTLS